MRLRYFIASFIALMRNTNSNDIPVLSFHSQMRGKVIIHARIFVLNNFASDKVCNSVTRELSCNVSFNVR